jgi:DNA polymerase III epsilon subunit-like protein
MKAFLFDTETTGLVENRSLRLDRQPHIIEFYGTVVDLDTGVVEDEIEYLIKPPKEELVTQKISEITGLTWNDLKDKLPFAAVANSIIYTVESAGDVVIAHNLSFDADMLEIEAERLGRTIAWPRKVCTIEATMHVKGHRLSLTMLHEYLFGEKFSGAHRAREDVAALVKVAVELRKRDWL